MEQQDGNPGEGSPSADSGMAETAGARMQHDVGTDLKVPPPISQDGMMSCQCCQARFGTFVEVAGWTVVLRVVEANSTDHDRWGPAGEDGGQSLPHCSPHKAHELRLGCFCTQNT